MYPCPRKFSETFQEQVRNHCWLQKPLVELGLLSGAEWLVVSLPCTELQSNWTLLGEPQELWIIGVMSFCPRFTFGSHDLFSHTRNMWISHSQHFIASLAFVFRLLHHPVMSWSADITKSRWDRLLSPAKERCSLKSHHSGDDGDLPRVQHILGFSSGVILYAQLWDEVFEGAASTSDRENWVQQPGCKANKLQEWGLCCTSHSLLAFEVNKQPGCWRKASCPAMWADTRRLPTLDKRGMGRKGIIRSVRQYSMAALKDDSDSKSFIICWKCLHLRTLAERRSRSSCWPKPRSHITYMSLGPASRAWLLFLARNEMLFFMVLLTQSAIIEGYMAADRQAGILSKEFGSAQGDRTRDKMIATTYWIMRVKLWPLQTVLRLEREREHTEIIYACLMSPPVIWQTLRSLDHLSLTEFPNGAGFEQVW